MNEDGSLSLSFGPPPVNYVAFVAAQRMTERVAGVLLSILGVLSLDTDRVEYEILPEGVGIGAAPSGLPGTNRQRAEIVELPDRFAFLEGLRPTRRVTGIKGFLGREYVAFQIGNRIVAECQTSENAIYVFDASDDSWLELIGLPKNELRTGNYSGYIGRVVHQGDWQSRLLELIRS